MHSQLIFEPTYKSPYTGQYEYLDKFTTISCRGEDCTVADVYLISANFQQMMTLKCSHDGGRTWLTHSLYPLGGYSPNQINDVCQIDARNIVAVADSGTILRSTDGGESWVLQDCPGTMYPGNLYLSHVHFADSLNGIAIGGRGYDHTTITTSDGGAHWLLCPFARDNMRSCHAYGNGMFRVFQGPWGRVFTTSDNWQTIDSTDNMLDSTRHSVERLQLYCGLSGTGTLVARGIQWDSTFSGGPGAFDRSTDFGQHWEKPMIMNSPYYPSIDIMTDPDRDTIIAANGSYDGTYGFLLSTDHGVSWGTIKRKLNATYPDLYIRGLALTGSGDVVAFFSSEPFGTGGFLARAHFGAADVKADALSAAQGSRIYPNPATESVTIAPDGERGTVYLLDLLGREVRHDEIFAQGSLSFSTASLPRGIYSVIIKHEGAMTRIGKLALVGR